MNVTCTFRTIDGLVLTLNPALGRSGLWESESGEITFRDNLDGIPCSTKGNPLSGEFI